MTETNLDRAVIFLLRVFVGWLFLYAGSWQILQNYSAGGFLNHVVTFHGFFALFATPTMLPLTDFLMKWGHLLIGLSLVFGLMVRISGPFGILLMITYHFAHMEWPFIQDHLSLFVDLPPRLRDRDRLPDGASRRPCLGSRRVDRTLAGGHASSGPATAVRLNWPDPRRGAAPEGNDRRRLERSLPFSALPITPVRPITRPSPTRGEGATMASISGTRP